MTLITSVSGIRGTIGGAPDEGLTPGKVVKYTAAFGQFLQEKNIARKVVIGRDARVSGPMIRDLVAGTLTGMGFQVTDLGLSTTPTVEIAVAEEKAAGGIIITASHNSKQWNALKLLNEKGEFLSREDGEKVLAIAEKEAYRFSGSDKLGQVYPNNTYNQKHIDRILALPLVDRDAIKKADFKIAIDCVNSTGGIIVPKLLNALGVTQLTELFCAPNGRFPHNPEPREENLNTLAHEVRFQNADLGIAVDPDVDRLAFVNEDGTYFGEEYTLVAVAGYVLQQKKGGNTVSNLSSSRALKEVTARYGGSYSPSAVGEVNVVSMMKEVDAVIGGEGNGGVIYPEFHYGRDALVGIALFLSHLAHAGVKASQLRSRYPHYYLLKNKVQLDGNVNLDSILEEIRSRYKNHPQTTIDGVKIDFGEEWVHLRRSNTEPVIRIYAESRSETTANNLTNKIMNDIKSYL